jgi:hypothetical protein
MYQQITDYLLSIGLSNTPEPGTFCYERPNRTNTAVCLSACIDIPIEGLFLNVIVHNLVGGGEVNTISLGVLTGDEFSTRHESYRLDFNRTRGWHLNINGQGGHISLNTNINKDDPNEYTKIIDLIRNYGLSLPSANTTGLPLEY